MECHFKHCQRINGLLQPHFSLSARYKIFEFLIGSCHKDDQRRLRVAYQPIQSRQSFAVRSVTMYET